MPTDTVLTDLNAETTWSSSILSRLSSPLSKRARNVFDFTIEPVEPYKTYAPGDTIHGHIILSVLKGFDITHLTIALHGYAKVYKHQSDRRPTIEELNKGQRSQGFEYLGHGLASLFQDEQVLCGSGFLKKQIYKFGFELRFPAKSLPTTIDFERGAIGYMISTTVTRPTTISPTMTKTISVQFRDRIDIDSLYTPKTRTISLEPINKRGKIKKIKTSSTTSTLDVASSSRRGLSRNDTSSTNRSQNVSPLTNPPLSPAPSEDTIDTTNTASTGSMQVVEHETVQRKSSPQTSETRSSITSSSANTITAVIEISRHGVIPGDVLPISISVTHTKPFVKGFIIATLYRMTRVDMHPAIPITTRGTKGKDKKAEYEDIYPPSRTGLGGLHFTSGSPSSAFRKDLAQSSTMMIINPQTLSAEVKTSIRIPVEDTLPTMTNIPGGMISFSYSIEVVIDLAGKIGEPKFLPSLTNVGPQFTKAQESSNQISSDWAHNILDTSTLRRTRSVVTAVLPLVIGTKDSRRDQRQADLKAMQYQSQGYDENRGWDGNMYPPDGYDPNLYWNEDCCYDEFGNPIDYRWHEYGTSDGDEALQPYVPPPEPQGEMDEKTRLRRHEELLMPSQPPEAGGSSVDARNLMPTAPLIVDSDDMYGAPPAESSSRPMVHLSISRASGRSGETIVQGTITPPPSLPDEEQTNQASEDKQELERQRLTAMASAPPVDDYDHYPSHSGSAPPAATAPVINDEEEYMSRALHSDRFGSETLPQYHR